MHGVGTEPSAFVAVVYTVRSARALAMQKVTEIGRAHSVEKPMPEVVCVES